MTVPEVHSPRLLRCFPIALPTVAREIVPDGNLVLVAEAFLVRRAHPTELVMRGLGPAVIRWCLHEVPNVVRAFEGTAGFQTARGRGLCEDVGGCMLKSAN